MTLDPAPTVRQAKWDEAFRGADYLNRIWARATARGEAEVMIKVPTTFVSTMAETILHMANHVMPLYRLQVDVEEHSRAMVAQAAQAGQTMRDVVTRAVVADFEQLLERRLRPAAKRAWPNCSKMGRDQWFALPLEVRQRWWKETSYGASEPSAELAGIIANR